MSNTLQKNHAKNMEDILEAKRLRYGKKLKKTMSDTPEIIETETGLKCVTLQDYREIERERDEAIADAHNYKEGYHIYSLHADFIERKLNETKKQIKNLISIAARAISLSEIDVDNDKFGIVSELRYELREIMQEEAK